MFPSYMAPMYVLALLAIAMPAAAQSLPAEPRSMSQDGPAGSHAPEDPHAIGGMWTLRYRVQITARPKNQQVSSTGLNNSATQCVPDGGLGTTPGYPVFIIQTAPYIAFVSEENHKAHLIYMAEGIPAYLPPAYLGHAVGHWEGDQLVVEIAGFRGKPDGYQETDRIRKTHNNTRLEDQTTIDSPGQPSQVSLSVYNWRPELRLQENICEDFIDPFGVGYFGGKPGASAP